MKILIKKKKICKIKSISFYWLKSFKTKCKSCVNLLLSKTSFHHNALFFVSDKYSNLFIKTKLNFQHLK